jgi:diguanylate cyclase (GGDEF)-like protein
MYQILEGKMVPLVVSAGFCKLFGFADREEAGRVMTEDMLSTIHPDDTARVSEALNRFAAGEDRLELVHRVKQWHSPSYRIIHSISEHGRPEAGEKLVYAWYMDEGSMQENSDTPEVRMSDSFRVALHEESILQNSHYDQLTGLPNMSYFFELAEEGKIAFLTRGKLPAVLLADLNGMKYFNQKYGFAEGDKLIRAFSQVLSRHFGSQYCNRFGQDHFAAFTENDGLEEKLEMVIAECAVMNGERNLPIRIGIYRYTQADPDISTACDRAKSACDSLRGEFHLRLYVLR